MHKSNRLPESPDVGSVSRCVSLKENEAQEMVKFSVFKSEYGAQECGKFSHCS